MSLGWADRIACLEASVRLHFHTRYDDTAIIKRYNQHSVIWYTVI